MDDEDWMILSRSELKRQMTMENFAPKQYHLITNFLVFQSDESSIRWNVLKCNGKSVWLVAIQLTICFNANGLNAHRLHAAYAINSRSKKISSNRRGCRWGSTRASRRSSASTDDRKGRRWSLQVSFIVHPFVCCSLILLKYLWESLLKARLEAQQWISLTLFLFSIFLLVLVILFPFYLFIKKPFVA